MPGEEEGGEGRAGGAAGPAGPGSRTRSPQRVPSSGSSPLNTGLVKRKQRKKSHTQSPPAEVPTGIFRGRIVLSRPDKPEENPPFSASPGLRTRGNPPRSNYAESVAVLLQAFHLTYRKQRSGGHIKFKKKKNHQKKNQNQNHVHERVTKAKARQGNPHPHAPTRKQPPIRKGGGEKKKKSPNLQKRSGLLEGFARGLALTNPTPESSPENLGYGAYTREGREREMPSRLFGQGLPSSGCNS